MERWHSTINRRDYVMTGKLSKLCALSWAERKVLLASATLLPIVWIILRAQGLNATLAAGDRSRAGRATPSTLPAGRMAALVAAAGSHIPFPSTCLTRSLVLLWLMRRRGMHAELRIGVCLAEGRLEAHAWLESEGRPLNSSPEVCSRYRAFEGPVTGRSFSFP